MKEPLTALVVFVACLACPILLLGHEDDQHRTLSRTLQLPEPPALTATAVSLQGERLIASGAEIVGLDPPDEPGQPSGRVPRQTHFKDLEDQVVVPSSECSSRLVCV
jgi:hypothetical protein